MYGSSEIIRGLAAEYNSVYLVDLEREVMTPFAINGIVAKKMLPSVESELDYADILADFAKNYVCDEDREGYLESANAATARRRLTDEPFYNFVFGRLDESGEPEYVEMRVTRMDDEDVPKHAMMTYRTVDGEYRERQLQADVIDALAENYTNVCSVSLETGQMRVFRFSGAAVGMRSTLSESMDHKFIMNRYAELNLPEEQREEFFRAANLETLCEKLKEDAVYQYHYRVFRDGEHHYYVMKCVRIGGKDDFKNIVIGFACEDEAKKAEAQALERTAIIEVTTQMYYGIIKIDIAMDSLKVVKALPNMDAFFKSKRSAREILSEIAEKMVKPTSRQALSALFDVDAWPERFADRSLMFEECEGATSGWSRVDVIACDRDEDGVATSALVAIRRYDEEKFREREREADYSIIDALGCEYHTLWAIDPELEEMIFIRSKGDYSAHYAVDVVENQNLDYSKSLRMYCDTFVMEEDRERVFTDAGIETLKAKVPERGLYSVSYQRQFQDGPLGFHEVMFGRIMLKSGNPGYIMGFRDISDTIRTEREKKRELADALVAAERANRSKTIFLNSMSHDIRTPMNAIIGFTALAEANLQNTERVHDYLGKISISSAHLLSLINDVLDMSRIESGKVVIDESPSDLCETVEDMGNIVQADLRARSLDFNIDTQDVVDSRVMCDELRLKQALLNIISNAIKFTDPKGSINVVVRQLGSAENGQADYEIKVSDTGIGMSPEFVEHIFEPFERERTSTVSGIQGTGLGMAITKNIVDMMDGEIFVESVPYEGSTFTMRFTFSLVEVDDEVQREGEETPTSGFKGRRLLVAEDNELNREIIQVVLEDAGFEIDVAHNGQEAVDFVEARDANYYDAVLMDVQMPVMDGHEATRQIRKLADPGKSSICIIAMTANAFEEDRQLAFEAGMSAHIPKPLNVDQLFGALRSFL